MLRFLVAQSIAYCAALAMFFGMNSPGWSQGLPRDKLSALKQATVYVKLKDGGNRYTGSGFLLGKIEDQGYIITNAHVVAPVGGRSLPVEIVLNSGSAGEKVLPAKVLAKDDSIDLAVLSVTHKELPTPIPSNKSLDLFETMPVYILGFPFGEVLATTEGHPEITIAKGGVSSLRKDQHGRLVAVQIDGSINPGNSGGPIVTEEGDLVGVAVAKIAGTQIGLAIPSADLRDMLLGRIASVTLVQTKAAGGLGDFDVVVELIDPLQRIKAVTLWTIPTEEMKERPQPDQEGRFSQASPQMQSRELAVTSRPVKGKLQLPLGKSGTNEKSYQFQISCIRSDKRTMFTSPAELLAKSTIAETSPPAASIARSQPGGFNSTSSGGARRPSPRSLSSSPEITSSETRVPPVKHTPRFAFPKPEAHQEDIAWAEVPQAQQVKVATLPVVATAKDDRTRGYAPVVWSGDGKSLWVVSAENRLLRFKTEAGITLAASLAVDANCQDIVVSKEGLVVALTSAGVLWVIDPESLDVVREIPVEGVRVLASSPATSLACAIGKSGLHVVDLKKGQVVHSVEIGPGKKIGRFGFVSSMRMSPDGKSLYLGEQQVTRLEVNGDDLKIAEVTQTLQSGHTQKLCLSPDGQWLAYPTGGGSPDTGGYKTGVFDTKNLKEYALIIDTGAYPGPLDVDPKSGQIYTTNTREIQFFSPRGGKQQTFPVLSRDARRILASPAGGQFLVWSDQHVAVYEVTPAP